MTRSSPKSSPAARGLKPLRGVRVLSLALNLPGPAAFMRLKAMGATCLKAEPPGPKGASGDPMGQYNPTAYATLHDGIKVITVDLKSDKGQARLHRELARTDVLLTSFRPSALAKLGLGWKALLPIVLFASVLGALVGIGMKACGALREGRFVPFGPFLAGGGIAVLLVGLPRVLDWLGWA